MASKLTRADREALVSAYRDWDPGVESSTALAARFGVSRQTLYRVLGEAGVPLRAQERPVRVVPPAGSVPGDRVLAEALLDRLRALELEVLELRLRLAECRGAREG
jgi:predicted DNA-binding transcriptional regulator YafY